MQCIGYGPVPCPPFSCCDAWWTLTVNAVSPWHTSVLIHASIEVRPSPMAPAFHSPCSSALAFCCEVVYVHSDSSVVWASTGFLSVSIVTPQRVLWNWLWPLPISRVCPTTRRVCLVTQSDLRAFGCPCPPPRKLALPLSSAGPLESMSMEMEVLCHVSTFDDSRTYRIFVVLFLTFLL